MYFGTINNNLDVDHDILIFDSLIPEMWSNFHLHGNYCDGKGELSDFIMKAKALNMTSVGFSSHAPLPFPNRWCMRPENLEHYLDEIDKLKETNADIEIYKSLEIDYIPELISPNDFKDKLDYTIGSIHFVDTLPDGTPWEIDGTHQFFLEGYEKIFRKNIKDVVARYYELTREMLENSSPDILGHLDKIKMQNINHQFFKEDERWYEDEIGKTIDCIKNTGCIVEVNTRGIYKQKTSTPYPSPWIIQRMLKVNIPITLSSDAHHPDELTNQFPETAKLLYDIGFRKISTLREGSWVEEKLTNLVEV